MELPQSYGKIDLKAVEPLRRGKVRDIFDLGKQLLMVASDRISAFDVVLPTTIPYKGEVLSSISSFWFKKTETVIGNHLITDNVDEYPVELTKEEKKILRGRSMLVKKGEMVDVECVVRGYLDGSGWRSYESTGKLFDLPLPRGLKQGDRLPEPLFTPTTKAVTGHDEYMSFTDMKSRTGDDMAVFLRDTSIELYEAAREFVYERGLILADTKFEFTVVDGTVLLADEVFTPDSSRYWDSGTYSPGGPQPSFDKQYIRDWLSTQDWDKTPPAPSLPREVVERSVEKYLEAYRKVTGKELASAGPS
ncbi:MAG: phosphoribosylaminoimidazolesuccinocarboxamide synthase [Spirochaetes bacterium]|nr:phosphoribosylaminoimidazolesuccinocarboxamide synthase [Spirochaetota bacterium]